jgi:hypothetical protein
MTSVAIARDFASYLLEGALEIWLITALEQAHVGAH